MLCGPGQLNFHLAALVSQPQQTLPQILRSPGLLGGAVLHQLNQHPAEALFSNQQYVKEGRYRCVRVSNDKIDDAVMRTAEFGPAQNRVRLRKQVALDVKLYLYASSESFVTLEQRIGAGFSRRIHGSVCSTLGQKIYACIIDINWAEWYSRHRICDGM